MGKKWQRICFLSSQHRSLSAVGERENYNRSMCSSVRMASQKNINLKHTICSWFFSGTFSLFDDILHPHLCIVCGFFFTSFVPLRSWQTPNLHVFCSKTQVTEFMSKCIYKCVTWSCFELPWDPEKGVSLHWSATIWIVPLSGDYHITFTLYSITSRIFPNIMWRRKQRAYRGFNMKRKLKQLEETGRDWIQKDCQGACIQICIPSSHLLMQLPRH